MTKFGKISTAIAAAFVAASVLAPQSAEARPRRYNPTAMWGAVAGGAALGMMMSQRGAVAMPAYGATRTVRECRKVLTGYRIDRRSGVMVPTTKNDCRTYRIQ